MSSGPGLRLVALAAAGPGEVKLDARKVRSITDALARARAGSVIDIGRGRYGADTETYPLRVPAGVTLRGPVPPDIPREARKHLPTPAPAELVGPSPLVEIIGDRVRLGHLKLHADTSGPALRVGPVPSEASAEPTPGGSAVDSVSGVVVDTCTITGGIELIDTGEVHLQWTTLDRGRLVARRLGDLRVTGSAVRGPIDTGSLIEVHDTETMHLEALVIDQAAQGIDARAVTRLHLSGGALLTEGIGVQVTDGRQVSIVGNRLRSDRPVHLTRCAHVSIAANGVERADVAFTLKSCHHFDIGTNHLGDVGIDVVNDA